MSRRSSMRRLAIAMSLSVDFFGAAGFGALGLRGVGGLGAATLCEGSGCDFFTGLEVSTSSVEKR